LSSSNERLDERRSLQGTSASQSAGSSTDDQQSYPEMKMHLISATEQPVQKVDNDDDAIQNAIYRLTTQGSSVKSIIDM
jgi:hypothetical protein